MAAQEQLVLAGTEAIARREADPLDMINLALEKGVAPEALTQLVALAEKVQQMRAKQAYAEAFTRMKPHLPLIIRTHLNTQTSSKYAALEDINTIVDPILAQYGFGSGGKVVSATETSVTVRVEIWHSGGHVESCEFAMPLDSVGIKGNANKTAPHAFASSVTYAKRIGICAMLNISTGDVDGNSSGASGGLDDLNERLDWIASANRNELFRIWKEAYDLADKAGDKNAMRALTEARDKRRKEIGQ